MFNGASRGRDHGFSGGTILHLSLKNEQEEITISLEVQNIDFYNGARKILKRINISAKRGEIIGVIGPNGAGKTTLIKIINKLLAPTRGAVFVSGKDISKMEEREIAREEASVPQAFHVDFDFSALEIVLMGRNPHLGRMEFESESDERIAKRCMKLTKTTNLAERSVLGVSGGERQRIAIASALAQEPKILLLDEPTANLDICYQIEMMELIRKLAREKKISIICAIHDLNLAARYCDYLVLLNKGKKVSMGKPESVLVPEIIERVYRIKVHIKKHSITHSPYIMAIRSK